MRDAEAFLLQRGAAVIDALERGHKTGLTGVRLHFKELLDVFRIVGFAGPAQAIRQVVLLAHT